MINCPLCFHDIDERALVCSGCGRDIAVPQHLHDERDLLIARRAELISQLERLQSRIAQKRPR